MPRSLGGARWLLGVAEEWLPLLGRLLGRDDCCGAALLRLLELVAGLPGASPRDVHSVYEALSRLIGGERLAGLIVESWPLLRSLMEEPLLAAPLFSSGSLVSLCLSRGRLWVVNDKGIAALYELGGVPRLLSSSIVPVGEPGRLLCRGGAEEPVPVDSLPWPGGLCSGPCRAYTTPSGRSLVYSGGRLYLAGGDEPRSLVGLPEPPDFVDLSPQGSLAVLMDSVIRVYGADGGLAWEERLGGGQTPRGVAWSPDGELLAAAMDEAVYVYSRSGRRLSAAWHRYLEPARPPGLVAWIGGALVHATRDGLGVAADTGGVFTRLSLSLGAAPTAVMADGDVLVAAARRKVLVVSRSGALSLVDAGGPVHVAARIAPHGGVEGPGLYAVEPPLGAAPGERIEEGLPGALGDALAYIQEGRRLMALAALAAYISVAAPSSYTELVELRTVLERLVEAEEGSNSA